MVADVARDKGVAAMGPVDSGLPEKDLPILLASVRSGATHLLTGDFKRYGTRHNSAFRLSNEIQDSLSVVVSQDSDVRFIRHKDGLVTHWSQA